MIINKIVASSLVPLVIFSSSSFFRSNFRNRRAKSSFRFRLKHSSHILLLLCSCDVIRVNRDQLQFISYIQTRTEYNYIIILTCTTYNHLLVCWRVKYFDFIVRHCQLSLEVHDLWLTPIYLSRK